MICGWVCDLYYIYTYIYIYIHILYIYLDLRSSKVPTKMKYCPKIMEVLKGYRCSCCAHPHRTFASRKTLCHEDQQRLAATDPSCLCAGCRDIMPLWRQRYGCHQKRGGSGFYWYFLSNMGMETGVFLRFLAIFVFIRSLGCTIVTNPHLARTPLEMAGHLLYQGQRKTH